MEIRIAPLANGDWQAYDETEDAPLLTVSFANQFSKLTPDERKQVLEAALLKVDELMGGDDERDHR